MSLIRSGSHTSGIDPARFGLPAGTALRYERSAPALAALLPTYAVLDSDLSIWHGPDSWMLPSWAQIWIGLTAGPIAVSIGRRRYDPLAAAVMYGVTSRAMPVTSHGGITVAIDVSPLGWARFVKTPADSLGDRITPLGTLLPAPLVRELVERLDASDRDLAVKGIIDDVFLRHLPPPHPSEPLVARMMAVIADKDVTDLPTVAARLDVSPATVQTLAKRYFGFPPKQLMMRRRFLRALAGMLVSDGPVDHAAVPEGYYNVPHFLRDAQRFLGMTPRRFLAMEMLYLRAVLRARRQVLGAATPTLDTAP